MSDGTSISPNSTKKDITGKEEGEENKKRRGPTGMGIQKFVKKNKKERKERARACCFP